MIGQAIEASSSVPAGSGDPRASDGAPGGNSARTARP
jgi:hypothetical protein